MIDDAKTLTTAEVEALPERIPSGWVLVRSDRILATTRALETAHAERDNARELGTELTTELMAAQTRAEKAERARDEALLAVDCGQDTVCATPPGCVRHWEERNRELVRERDVAKSFFAELVRERDTARFDRDAVLAEGVELLEQRDRARRALAAEIETTRATKARVAELVTALEGMIEPADDVGSELGSLSAGCGEYLGRLDMAIDNARAALAKAKGGTT
jgi:hypothetical protein